MMTIPLRRLRAVVFAAGAALGLSACVTDGYYGGGYGYADSYYSGYGGSPYYGWYDGYYYPGSGGYVYDRGGRRHGWNDRQRRYWEARRVSRPDRGTSRDNWSGYRQDRPRDRARYRAGQGVNRDPARAERWQELRKARQERGARRGIPHRQNRRGTRATD